MKFKIAPKLFNTLPKIDPKIVHKLLIFSSEYNMGQSIQANSTWSILEYFVPYTSLYP